MCLLPSQTQFSKVWSCVTLQARGWCHWHQMEAALLQCLSEAALKTGGWVLIAWRYNLRQVSCKLRDFSHWPWFTPDHFFLAMIYKLLFVSNLGLSSCFTHLGCASIEISCLTETLISNKVKGKIKHPTKAVLSYQDGFRWSTHHPDLKRAKDEPFHSFDYFLQFLIALNLHIISYS